MAKRYAVGQPSLGSEELDRVTAVMRSGQLTHGETVEEFERGFAAYLGTKHAVACASGTAALHLALLAYGVQPGDEVLVPDLTFVATANAVSYIGATPVLVDVDPETWTIDLDEAAQHVSPKTVAILPVHLYGVPCDMDEMHQFASKCGIGIIEDAAEALGARWAGVPCGTSGVAGAFSFYGNKILTTGEGGAVVTNDDNIADTARLYRGQCQTSRYQHADIGFNYRMTEIQAAIGLAQLDKLDEMLRHRQRICDIYMARTSHLGYSSMGAWYHGCPAPWLFTLQSMWGSRDRMAELLENKGVETRQVFVPMHRQPMYARPDGEFRMASLISDTGLSLPTHMGLSLDDVADICDLIDASVREL